MGEQSRPMSPMMLERSRPRSPGIAFASELVGATMLLQHWMGPVEHCPELESVLEVGSADEGAEEVGAEVGEGALPGWVVVPVVGVTTTVTVVTPVLADEADEWGSRGGMSVPVGRSVGVGRLPEPEPGMLVGRPTGTLGMPPPPPMGRPSPPVGTPMGGPTPMETTMPVPGSAAVGAGARWEWDSQGTGEADVTTARVSVQRATSCANMVGDCVVRRSE